MRRLAVVVGRRPFMRTSLRVAYARDLESALLSPADVIIPLVPVEYRGLGDGRLAVFQSEAKDEEVAEELGLEFAGWGTGEPPRVVRVGGRLYPDLFGVLRGEPRTYVPGPEYLVFSSFGRVLALRLDVKVSELDYLPVAASITAERWAYRLGKRASSFGGSFALRVVKEIERGSLHLVEVVRVPGTILDVLRGLIRDPLAFTAGCKPEVAATSVVRMCCLKSIFCRGRPVIDLPRIVLSRGYPYSRRVGRAEAVVSDMDGVLLKLPVNWRALAGLLAEEGLLREGETLISAYFRVATEDSELADKLHRMVEEHEMRACSLVGRRESLVRAVEAVKRAGLAFFVVSKQSSSVIRECLNRLGILGLVDGYLGREASLLRREQISAALRELGVGPERAVFLGDRIEDLTSSASLGVAPLMVTRNPLRRRQFRELGAMVFPSAEKALRYVVSVKTRGRAR